ncbi:RNA-binding domain-containing protein [Martensiomyces pterosporus]|nr:RNA-binding domain-containing protein [Martensiomyces pterosporus]
MAQKFERNQEASVYIGNLDDRVTDELIWELMVQAGPVVNVHLPKDRITQSTQGYGFCEFQSEEDADYAVKIMNMVKLYGKPMRVNKSSADRRMQDVGAKLFVGNLDPDVDEKLLFDTFSAFGSMVQNPKIARNPDSGNSRGFAFVSYATFEASDAAIEAMNGQYLANKPVSVNYAFKKDAKGERHGSAAERLLAAQARKNDPMAAAAAASGGSAATPTAAPNMRFANVGAGGTPSAYGQAPALGTPTGGYGSGYSSMPPPPVPPQHHMPAQSMPPYQPPSMDPSGYSRGW